MLVGRAPERKRLRASLAAARAGRGSALVVRGEPGIGKTALLEELRAGADGFRVLVARGVESESRLAYAGLSDLVRPVLDRLEQIPEAQRAALRAALALGPPVVPDRFAAYAATLSLLGALAAEGPVLVVVDDAHWLDVPSQEALLFCARRIADEPVAMVAASRERPPERLEVAGVEELELGGLAEEEARRLLERVPGPPLAAGVAARLIELAQGNPLALVELARSLRPEERAGRAALPRTPPAGRAVVRAYRRRIEALDPDARRALLLAATGDDGAPEPLLSALGEGARPALARAEAAGLLRLADGRVAVAHPLVRSAAIELAPPEQRRAAHRALAGALDRERDAEQRAWHLAEATVGPDEETAAALEAAAMRAAARTGYAAAASALEGAAGLSAAPGGATRRAIAGSQMAMAAGRTDWALAQLDRADPAAAAPGEVAHLRGMLLTMTGDLDRAYQLLVRTAREIAAHDPARAAVMLSDAALTRPMAGDCHTGLATAREAFTVARRAPALPPIVLAALGATLTLRGDARAARSLIEELDRVVPDIDPLSAEGQMLVMGTSWRAWIDARELVGERSDAWIARARASGALGFLAFPLLNGCDADVRAGRWARARARAQESADILAETGQLAFLGYVLSTLGLIEAGLGLDQGAREHVALARRNAPSDVGSVAVYTGAALGLLALGDGDAAAAARELERTAETVERAGLTEPATVSWQPDLVEAYTRLGRIDEARRALATLSEQAHRTGGRWARAVTCRCRGLIDEDIDRHFGEALALHEGIPMPFERARTELCFGQRLRRAGRRTEARAQLERALSAFEDLGAEPWARQAREEIAASGARLRPRRAGRPEEGLSPRELQVATAVAGGLTNREAAARLFLSEKTIERHLGSVYRKLGLRSRTELAARMARGGAAPAAHEGATPPAPHAPAEPAGTGAPVISS